MGARAELPAGLLLFLAGSGSRYLPWPLLSVPGTHRLHCAAALALGPQQHPPTPHFTVGLVEEAWNRGSVPLAGGPAPAGRVELNLRQEVLFPRRPGPKHRVLKVVDGWLEVDGSDYLAWPLCVLWGRGLSPDRAPRPHRETAGAPREPTLTVQLSPRRKQEAAHVLTARCLVPVRLN